MTDMDRERFRQLCVDDLVMHGTDADGIGTYNERRLHRILKRYVTDDAACYEVKVGKSVADILKDGRITEIQTSAFRPLERKIGVYLDTTDHAVSVIHPVISEKTIIRADKETGEVMYSKRSPKHERDIDVLPQMYYLRDFVANMRFEVRLLHVKVDEYRYSERVRYRREGAYDKDVRPICLLGETVLCGKDSYRNMLPPSLFDREFTSAEFSAVSRLKGRKLSLAIGFLVYVGIFERRSEGRRYFYRITDKGEKG